MKITLAILTISALLSLGVVLVTKPEEPHYAIYREGYLTPENAFVEYVTADGTSYWYSNLEEAMADQELRKNN